jgi:hypothetical protein
MIHPLYQGKASAAITEFRGEYLPRLDINSERLLKNLDDDVKCLGQGYKVLAMYHNISPMAFSGPITRALNDLNSGREVDLEKILD